MLLELSLRSLIALLPLLTQLIAGCDRQSAPGSQANEAAAAATAAASASKIDRTHKGEPAPDYPFLDARGAKRTLADFRGKPVLVNLWATWCAPCVKEMPTLDALAAREAGKLQVVTISQDFDPAKARAYLREKGFSAIQLQLDAEARFSTGMRVNLPTTILFDAAGAEVWRFVGDYDWSSSEAAAMINKGSG